MKQLIFVLITLVHSTNLFSQKLIPFDKGLYKCGLKNQEGKVVVKPIYISIHDDGTHFVLYSAKNQGVTLMRYDGTVVIPQKYLDLELSGDNRYYKATAYNAEYKKVKGYIDLDGKEVVPVKYYDIQDYYKDHYLITRGKYNEYGLISVGSGNGISAFKEVTPPVHSDLNIRNLADGSIAIIVRDIQQRYASLDSNGKIVTDYVNWFLPLRFINTDVWIAQNKDAEKYGLVDAFLKPVVPFIYESMYSDRTNKDQYIIYKDKKVGIIHKSGNVVVQPIYQNIRHLDCSMIPVMLNNKWGILDVKGKQVLPFEYDDIGDCSVFEIDLKKDNKWSRVDIYTGKKKTDTEVYSDVVAKFDELGKIIVKKIDEFALEHNAIQKTKFTTETELQKRFTQLLNTKGYDIKYEIQKATGLLEDFLKQYPNTKEEDKKHIRGVILEFQRTWTNLDKAKNYKETIFTIKEETVEGVIEEVLKKYGG